ncbi:DJ-1/PfpI family protein [Thermoactinospora rubra]|uniref:DJ-1/PfpI family protein n=1 Tax=Thermoactinospora rubra TaxID=1088767 RepID=UPI00117DC168|nr:DJ-1/PfpI family protein [Thermoactinospora rubra]
MPPAVKRLVLIGCGAGLSLLAAAGAGAAGVAVSMGHSYAAVAPAVPAGQWPEPRPTRPGRTVVAVVVGSTGSVVTDVLAPYEVFARSDRFSVHTVSARRQPVPLSGGPHLLPDYALDEAPPPDVVVVPAVVDPTGEREASLRAWIARQAARGARVLGVCAGSELVAATGVLDGRRATSFWANIDGLRSGYPQVRWVAGERYVEDGPVTTTAGVTSGLVGALRLVERLAGAAEAERMGRDLAYPGWSVSGSTAIAERRLAPGDLAYGLNAAFPWFGPTVGVGLQQGVGEVDVAAAFEVYAGASFAARAVPLASGPVVTTRHGVTLLARPAEGVDRVDRFVVPGARAAAQVDPALTRWAAGRGIPVELPHRDQAGGEFSFDPVLRDLAAHADVATARATAKFTEYPSSHLRLSGAAWPWRPTALLVAALALGGLAPPLIVRLAAVRRRPTPPGS